MNCMILMLWVVSRYNISGLPRPVHRYLPPEVSELVVYYLWLVLPFRQELEAIALEREEQSPFLFSKDIKNWTSDRFREALAQETALGIRVRLTISDYRHCAIAIARFIQEQLRKALQGPDSDSDSDSDSGDEGQDEGDGPDHDSYRPSALTWDHMAGHSTTVADSTYARLRTEAPGASASMRQRCREACLAWHQFLGLGRGRRSEKRRASDEPSDEPSGEPSERPAGSYESARRRQWKRLRSTPLLPALQKLMAHDGPAHFRGIQEQALRAIMDGESYVLVVMATGTGKSLLFMLPASVDGARTTVVVVPLLSLRQNLIERCTRLNISASKWESGQQNPSQQEPTKLVFVTPETALTKQFLLWLTDLHRTAKLDRIVIDECHTVLQGSQTFRPRLGELGELAAIGARLVMLTATLPPTDEGELCSRMYIPRSQLRVFRAPTTRSNIRYSVQEFPQRHLADALVNLIRQHQQQQEQQHQQQHRQQHQQPPQQTPQQQQQTPQPSQQQSEGSLGKTIIYCRSVNAVKNLALALKCPAYYAGAADREETLTQLTEGRVSTVVATNALGMGIDWGDVRLVIHVGVVDNYMPAVGLDEYAQESGRAGRDGKPASAVILIPRDTRRPARGSTAQKRLLDLVFNGMCRRFYLDKHLDGLSREQCEEGEEKCDICSDASYDDQQAPQEVGAEDMDAYWEQQECQKMSRELQRAEQQLQALTVENLHKLLRAWSDRCSYCHYHGHPGADDHKLVHCQEPGAFSARDLALHLGNWLIGEKGYQEGSCCYKCSCPPKICPPVPKGQKKQCIYRGVVMGATATLLVEGKKEEVDAVIKMMEEAAKEKAPVQETPERSRDRSITMGEQEFALWLGLPCTVDGVAGTVQSGIFLKLGQYYDSNPPCQRPGPS
jgi:superfamily II DNA helicase RecQ